MRSQKMEGSVSWRRRLSSMVVANLLFGLAVPAAGQLAQRVADLNLGGWTTRWGGLCGDVDRWPVGALDGFVFGDKAGGGCRIFTVDVAAGSVTPVSHLGESGAGVGEILGRVGELTYFVGVTAATGAELWRTDGTPAGTFELLDSEPGEDGMSWSSWFAVSAPYSYFPRRQDETGWELWRTDGTREGTALVRDVWPGPEHGTLHGGAFRSGIFFFSADDGVHGPEVWRTDGTSAGTFLLTEFAHESGYGAPFAFAVLPAAVIFTSATPTGGLELWRTDGTVAGTAQIWSTEDLLNWDSPPPVVQGGRAIFGASKEDGTLELWITDGTAQGTTAVATVPAPAGSSFVRFVPLGVEEWLFFPDDGVHGAEPWRSDGTPAGTHLVADVRPGALGSIDPYAWVTTATLDGRILMTLDDGAHGVELWITDGGAGGTSLVADLVPGPYSSLPEFLGEQDGVALFEFDGDLWRSDGTAAGTGLLAAFGGIATPSDPSGLTEAGDLIYFDAHPPVADDWRHPARSDGTESGTYFLAGDLGGYFGESDFSVLDGGTVVANTRGDEESLIWSSAGEEILQLAEVSYPCSVRHYCGLDHAPPSAGPTALFAKWSIEAGTELWSTDGSLLGTGLFLDLRPGTASGSPRSIVDVEDEVWFTAVGDDGIASVWRSGGTLPTTEPFAVLSEAPATRPSELWPLDPASDRFLFLRDEFEGHELWVSSGDGGLPELLQVGLEGWSTERIGVAGDRLLFATAEFMDPGVGRELWASDGTPAGTRLVRDLWSGPAGSRASRGVELDGRVLFAACEPVAGCELWTSDGTTAGTVRFLDLEPGPGSSSPAGLSRLGDHVYFSARRLATGREVWVTDGTAVGTFALEEIAAGPYSSIPEVDEPGFVPWSDIDRTRQRIFFAGDDGTGAELWALPVVLFYDGFQSGDAGRWSDAHF